MVKVRNYGLDVFRILCCMGVLGYHTFDDVLPQTIDSVSSIFTMYIYYGCGFCVPGFFLLSGYLISEKVNAEPTYFENKIFSILKTFFFWIVFWYVVVFLGRGDIINIFDEFSFSLLGKGFLPVAWFLFTYCVLIALSYPLLKLKEKAQACFIVVTGLVLVFIACGGGASIISSRAQSAWLHLYVPFFMLGMVLHYFQDHFQNQFWIRYRSKINLAMCILFTILYLKMICIDRFSSAPYCYYGKWYYDLWLISIFLLCCNLRIRNPFWCTLLPSLSQNTIFVYLGHLPCLIYLQHRWAQTSLWQAAILFFLLLIVLNVVAEIFKRLPVFRKLI